MDTSKEYIIMCEAATEIQDQVNKKSLLHVYAQKWNVINQQEYNYLPAYGIEKYQFDLNWLENKTDTNLIGLIWLPTQDQLQELISMKRFPEEYRTWNLINAFYRYTTQGWDSKKTDKHRGQLAITNPSFEQLWLMFLMLINYSKQWNDKTKLWEVII